MVLFLAAALLGLLAGFLRGGNITNLSQVRLRGAWVLLIAVLIQLPLFPLVSSEPLIKLGDEARGYWHVASYLFLLLFIGLNLRERALWVMALGVLANFLVIAVNKGHIPASLEALKAVGAQNTAAALSEGCYHANVMLMNSHAEFEHCSQTYLNFLGDIFYLPLWVPMARPFSLGDALLALGLIYFLQLKMRRV